MLRETAWGLRTRFPRAVRPNSKSISPCFATPRRAHAGNGPKGGARAISSPRRRRSSNAERILNAMRNTFLALAAALTLSAAGGCGMMHHWWGHGHDCDDCCDCCDDGCCRAGSRCGNCGCNGNCDSGNCDCGDHCACGNDNCQGGNCGPGGCATEFAGQVHWPMAIANSAATTAAQFRAARCAVPPAARPAVAAAYRRRWQINWAGRPDRRVRTSRTRITRCADRAISWRRIRRELGRRKQELIARTNEAQGLQPLGFFVSRLPRTGRVHPLKRPTMSEMFCPPNPKLLLRATSQRASRRLLGM